MTIDARVIRIIGISVSVAYAGLIIWVYTQQPRTVAQVTGGLAASVGAYQIDRSSFNDGLQLFRKEQFAAARAAFERADPAERDPTTQFYIAYSYYRQGWGRLYNDDELFKAGLEAVSRAIAASEDGRVVVTDSQLGIQSADELQAELRQGITRDTSDFNPLRVFRPRK